MNLGRRVEDVVKQSSSIVKEIKRSRRLYGILKSKAHPTKTTVALKLPVKTRLGSNVICLESLEENKTELQQLAVDKSEVQTVIFKEMKASILSDVFWHKWHDILTVEFFF